MQPLDLVFPEEVLTEAEQDMCFEVFAHNEAVRKQLRILGANCGKELLGVSTLNSSAEKLVQQHSVVSGRLSVITTLLSIGVEQ